MARTSYLHTARYESKTFTRTTAGARYPFLVVRVHTDAARAAVLAELDRREAATKSRIAEVRPEIEATRARYEECSAALAWWRAEVPGKYSPASKRWLEVESGLEGESVVAAEKLGFMPETIRSDKNCFNSARGIYSGLDILTTWEKEIAETAQGKIDIEVGKLAEIGVERAAEIEGATGTESATLVGWTSRVDLAAKLLRSSTGYGRFVYDTFVLVEEVEIVERVGRARKTVYQGRSS